MAPLAPFLSDYLWNVLRPAHAADSVHLASWPIANPALIDRRLADQMDLTRRLVELGRSARASAAVEVRQPLARALVSAAGFSDLPAELRRQVTDEPNVRVLEPLAPDDVLISEVPRSGWAVAAGNGETVALDVAITPELRGEGLAREVVRTIKDAR